MPSKSYAIGIDFGTTKSYLSYMAGGVIMPEIARFQGDLTPTNAPQPFFRASSQLPPVPTLLGINTNGSIYSGYKAIEAIRESHANSDIKLVSDLKLRIATWIDTPNLPETDLPLQALLARFFYDLKRNAHIIGEQSFEQLGVTITIPAKAEIHQRMITRFAGKVAGFSEDAIDLIEEPVAAFLFHWQQNRSYFEVGKNPQNILIIDFGGGTCDLAVIQHSGKSLPIVKGRSMGYFGGNKIDELFLRHLWLEGPNDLPSWDEFQAYNPVYKRILQEYAKLAKEQVSTGLEARLRIVGAIPDRVGDIYTPPVTPTVLKALLEKQGFPVKYADTPDLVETTVKGHIIKLIEAVLHDAKLERNDIHKLILAGSSSQIIGMKDWTKEYFTENGYAGKPNPRLSWDNESKSVLTDHSESCIARGAAIHQYLRQSRNKQIITPTLSIDYWVEYPSSDPSKRKKITIANKGAKLPIDKMGFRKAVNLYPIYQAPDGTLHIEIGQGGEGNWSDPIELPYSSNALLGAWFQAILFGFKIDEFGILEEVQFIKGNPITGYNFLRPFSETIEDRIEPLKQISLRTQRLSAINQLRKLVGIHLKSE